MEPDRSYHTLTDRDKGLMERILKKKEASEERKAPAFTSDVSTPALLVRRRGPSPVQHHPVGAAHWN